MNRGRSNSSSSGSSFVPLPSARGFVASRSPTLSPTRRHSERSHATSSLRTRRVSYSSSDSGDDMYSPAARRFLSDHSPPRVSVRRRHRSPDVAELDRNYRTGSHVSRHDYEYGPRSIADGGLYFEYHRPSRSPPRRRSSQQRNDSSYPSENLAERGYRPGGQYRGRENELSRLPSPRFRESRSPASYDTSPPPQNNQPSQGFGRRLGDYSPDRSSNRRFGYSIGDASRTTRGGHRHRRNYSPSPPPTYHSTGPSVRHSSRDHPGSSPPTAYRFVRTGSRDRRPAVSLSGIFSGFFGRRAFDAGEARHAEARRSRTGRNPTSETRSRGIRMPLRTPSPRRGLASLPFDEDNEFPRWVTTIDRETGEILSISRITRYTHGDDHDIDSWEDHHQSIPSRRSSLELEREANQDGPRFASSDYDRTDDLTEVFDRIQERRRLRRNRLMNPPQMRTRTLAQSDVSADGPTQCNICLDERAVGDEVAVLDCGHWFDKDCLDIWMRDNPSCPVCRAGVR